MNTNGRDSHFKLLTGILVIFLIVIYYPCFGQNDKCSYTKDEVSLNLAEQFRRANDFTCAKIVLNEIIKNDTISNCAKAEAQIMLGMVNYRIFRGKSEEYDSSITHFIGALENCPTYKGPIENDVTGLGKLFAIAKDSLSQLESWKVQKQQDSLTNICDQYTANKRKNNKLKIITGIVGLGATVGILVFEGKANDAYDEYKSCIAPSDIESAWDDYEKNRNLRNIMIGAVAVSVAAEIFWFIKSPQKPDIDCAALLQNSNNKSLGLHFNGNSIQLTMWLPGL